MADPAIVKSIMAAVSIPVMAKVRIGHITEARILESLGVDYIDESEVLTPADDRYHLNKHDYRVPFVCGARNLGEALRRIGEGAAMIRTKGEPGTGNVIEAVRHIREVMGQIRHLCSLRAEELPGFAKEIAAPLELVQNVHATGRLPVVNFAAGGISTPADAALMMQLGCDGIFVGSGIFKSADPAKFAKAIVAATTNFNDPEVLAQVSEGLGEAMPGLEISSIAPEHRMQERGW
jgi:pyridoxal 5'-phosphate synthase pdxS subunit